MLFPVTHFSDFSGPAPVSAIGIQCAVPIVPQELADLDYIDRYVVRSTWRYIQERGLGIVHGQ
jgi:hypothetical protein